MTDFPLCDRCLHRVSGHRQAGTGGTCHLCTCSRTQWFLSKHTVTHRIEPDRLRRVLWETDVYWQFANDEKGHGDLNRFADELASWYERLPEPAA